MISPHDKTEQKKMIDTQRHNVFFPFFLPHTRRRKIQKKEQTTITNNSEKLIIVMSVCLSVFVFSYPRPLYEVRYPSIHTFYANSFRSTYFLFPPFSVIFLFAIVKITYWEIAEIRVSIFCSRCSGNVFEKKIPT